MISSELLDIYCAKQKSFPLLFRLRDQYPDRIPDSIFSKFQPQVLVFTHNQQDRACFQHLAPEEVAKKPLGQDKLTRLL